MSPTACRRGPRRRSSGRARTLRRLPRLRPPSPQRKPPRLVSSTPHTRRSPPPSLPFPGDPDPTSAAPASSPDESSAYPELSTQVGLVSCAEGLVVRVPAVVVGADPWSGCWLRNA